MSRRAWRHVVGHGHECGRSAGTRRRFDPFGLAPVLAFGLQRVRQSGLTSEGSAHAEQ